MIFRINSQKCSRKNCQLRSRVLNEYFSGSSQGLKSKYKNSWFYWILSKVEGNMELNLCKFPYLIYLETFTAILNHFQDTYPETNFLLDNLKDYQNTWKSLSKFQNSWWFRAEAIGIFRKKFWAQSLNEFVIGSARIQNSIFGKIISTLRFPSLVDSNFQRFWAQATMKRHRKTTNFKNSFKNATNTCWIIEIEILEQFPLILCWKNQKVSQKICQS